MTLEQKQELVGMAACSGVLLITAFALLVLMNDAVRNKRTNWACTCFIGAMAFSAMWSTHLVVIVDTARKFWQ